MTIVARSRYLGMAVLLLISTGILTLSIRTLAAQVPATTESGQEKKATSTGTRITDAWITMKIHSQFIPEDVLEGSNIDVDTKSGVVTLTGTVTSEAGRSRAVAIAKATDGVKSVSDKLRIGPAEPAIDTGAAREAAREAGREAKGAARTAGRTITDGWIKSKIYAQFLTENALEDSDIDIDVAKGVVTLNGTVRSEAGRVRAVAIAKATEGVKSVKDALKVSARTS